MVVRIFRHFIPTSTVLLAIIEISMIAVAWNFSLLDNSASPLGPGKISAVPSFILALSAGMTMMVTGLYHNDVFVDFKILAGNIIISLFFLCPIVFAAWLYLQHGIAAADMSLWQVYSRTAISWLVCILLTRAVFLTLADLDLFKTRVVVLGTEKKARRIASFAAEGRNCHFIPTEYINSNDIAREDPTAIARCALERKAKEIVVATDDRRGLPVHQLLQCRLAGIRVIDFLDFVERETKSVDISALQPGWLIFSDGFCGCRTAQLRKRCLDIVLSLGLLLFTLPLILLTGILIVLDSPGPILYRQTRVGLGGRAFVLLKFRSMRSDAENDGEAQWARAKDPRVTRVGRIIRKLRIDELPQLLNVLRGDMSLVGPRPERPEFVAGFREKIPFYGERHCVKPGITGWAQINYPYGASLDDARNKLSYDLYYVKNHGVFLDIVIVLQTIRVILWADGAR